MTSLEIARTFVRQQRERKRAADLDQLSAAILSPAIAELSALGLTDAEIVALLRVAADDTEANSAWPGNPSANDA